MSEILPDEIWAIDVKYSRYWSPSSSESLGYTKYIRADLARGWLPIDTAPDGRAVMVIKKVALTDNEWFEPQRAYRNGEWWFTEPGSRIGTPDMWQPLPPPPEGE